MQNPIQIDPDERVFTFSDIADLFRSKKKQLLQIAIFSSVFVFGALNILKGPQYKVEATFREGGERNEGGGLKDLLMGMGGAGGGQAEAVSIMKSRQVLGPLVEKLGLQATVPQSRWIAAKVFRRFRDNWKAERGQFIEDLDPFVFANVKYRGELPVSLQIRFEDPDHFLVYEGDLKKPVIRATVGSPVCFKDVQFTLIAPAKALKLNKLYPLQIAQLVETVGGIRKQISIIPQKLNKSIYDITVSNRDRKLGLQIVNGLMDEYQSYLMRDYEALAGEQLAYLERRQSDICNNMEHVFDEYAGYMRKNIAEVGFSTLEAEAENFSGPYQSLSRRLFEIDLQTAHLEPIVKSDKDLFPTNLPNISGMDAIAREQTVLKQQRDLLDLSIRKTAPFSEETLKASLGELEQIRSERQQLIAYLDLLDKNPCVPPLVFGAPAALSDWAQRLGSSLQQKEDFADYLENYTHLLSVRERMLQERCLYGNPFSSELEGLTLEAAQTLFLGYNTKLDEAEAKIQLYQQVEQELAETDVELASLASILTDPFSKELISKASIATLNLKDEKNRTSKEGLRYEEELKLQRQILSTHLEQLIKVEEVNALLVREKMAVLQQVQFEGIHKRLSVLSENAKQKMRENLDQLAQEKKIVQDQMAELRLQGLHLPEKWRQEKWLKLKTDMGMKIMQGLTEIVEAKTIAHHLHRFESKALDIATLPTIPVPPLLMISSLFGGLALSGAFFGMSMARTILCGFPSSFAKLKALRFPLLGQISFFCDGPAVDSISGTDLETLRQMGLFLKQTPKPQVVALIGGKGPDYSFALAQNLARLSLRSIVLRCDFHAPFNPSDQPGLLQIWQGEVSELPVRSKSGVDWINAGGYSPYGVEVIQSPPFQQLIDVLKQKYDFVFILTRASLTQSESLSLLGFADKAVVTVHGEPTEELTPFIDWAYHGEYVRLQFMTSL